MRFSCIVVAITLCAAALYCGEAENVVKDKRPRLAIVIAEDEYKTNETLPKFARAYLSKDFQVQLIFGNEKNRNDIPDIGALEQSDVVLISVRRRPLPPAQLDAVKRFVAAGKAVVGIRTACHAFCLMDKNPPEGLAAWPTFDQDVLGCNYHNHYPNNTPGASKTFIKIAPGAEQNPVLAGIKIDGELATTGSLYKVLPLVEGANSPTVLMLGRYDQNTPLEPLAWTRIRKDGGRVFYTTLGHPDDFEQAHFNRLLLNGISWAAGLEIPKELPEK